MPIASARVCRPPSAGHAKGMMEATTTNADTRPCVLFVDDVPSARRLFDLRFKHTFRVICAADANEALDVLRTRPVGVLVTDHYMPGMTGVELCREVAERWPSVHRLVVTAAHDAKLVSTALRVGRVHGVAFKPWSEELLEGRIRAALEGPLEGGPGQDLARPPGPPTAGLTAASSDALMNSATAARLALEVAETHVAEALPATAARTTGALGRCFRLAESALRRIETVVGQVSGTRRGGRREQRWGTPIGFHDLNALLDDLARRLHIELVVNAATADKDAAFVFGQRALLALPVAFALLRATGGRTGSGRATASVISQQDTITLVIGAARRPTARQTAETNSAGWRQALDELASLSGCAARECDPPRPDGTVLVLRRAPAPPTVH